MLRAMKFNESGLKCWPCQCNVVLSQTYSSRGDYLWNVNCPGNVTESRGGGRGRKVEEGEGTESRGGGGRESNPDWQGISYQRNRNKLRLQYETVSQAHFTLCLGNYKKKTKTKTKNKVLVTVKSFSPVYLSILISCHVLILIGEIIDSGLKVNISFFKKNTDKYLGLLDFITLTRSLFTCVRQKKIKSMKKLKGKRNSSESYF